jgi:hypothetical protein
MAVNMNASPERSKPSPNSSIASFVTRDALYGFILCVLACLLALIAFWRLGGSSSDMLTITDYFSDIPAAQKRTFGYGGPVPTSDSQLKSYSSADVSFQSRAMSSFCFSISKRDDGSYWVEGIEDKIQVGGKVAEKGNAVQLKDGDRLKTIGRYGNASFSAHLDEQPNRVRLHLDSPVYYKLNSDKTRVSFGQLSEIVSAPIDEIVIRTALKQSQSESFTLEKKKDAGGFALAWEDDLARPASTESEVLAAIRKPGAPGGKDVTLTSGDSVPVGTAVVEFTANKGSSLFGACPTWTFGLKFAALVILFAVAFGLQGLGMHDSQVRLPHGPIIFGCVAVFAAVGLTLTARDYLLPPYDQGRFPEYSRWLLISLVTLYLIRIPLDTFREWKWARSFPVFLLIFILLNRPLDGFLTFPSLKSLVMFVAGFFAGAVAIHWIMRAANKFTELAVGAVWSRVLLVILTPVALVMAVALITNGHSALTLAGVRIHLPTIFSLFYIFGTVLSVTVTENENAATWRKHRSIAIGAMLIGVGIYYVLSHGDHGGTAILGMGVFAAMWTASRKERPWIFTVGLAALLVIALYFAATIMPQERIEIAWGGEESAARYFDEAVNLRTARDLGRAGGLFGLYDQLYVPSSVSMNIYNDLVTAYIVGFFGLVGLSLVAACHYLFYTRLLDGVLGIRYGKSKHQPGGPTTLSPPSARPAMPSPFAIRPPEQEVTGGQYQESMNHVLTAFAVSLIAVFLFQLLWVFTATLWRRVPISGLDLQPISASVISVVAFIVILLGSVNFVHNVKREDEAKLA